MGKILEEFHCDCSKPNPSLYLLELKSKMSQMPEIKFCFCFLPRVPNYEGIQYTNEA